MTGIDNSLSRVYYGLIETQTSAAQEAPCATGEDYRMPRVLLISRSPSLRRLAAAALDGGPYEFAAPDPPADILQFAHRNRPDCLILDLDALGPDWQAVCRKLRAERKLSPLTLLLVFPDAKFADLAAQADLDDFIVQPFAPAELRARLARVAGSNASRQSGAVIEAGALVIDQEKYEVRVQGEPIMLTYQEYEFLRFLAANPNRTFTRTALLHRVWGYDYLGGTRTVDVHVTRLRAKLGTPAAEFLQTVRGVGYRLSPSRASE